MFESIPQAPVIINSAWGNSSDKRPIKGMEPPVPTSIGFCSNILIEASESFYLVNGLSSEPQKPGIDSMLLKLIFLAERISWIDFLALK
jgi:hypothetical protein